MGPSPWGSLTYMKWNAGERENEREGLELMSKSKQTNKQWEEEEEEELAKLQTEESPPERRPLLFKCKYKTNTKQSKGNGARERRCHLW